MRNGRRVAVVAAVFGTTLLAAAGPAAAVDLIGNASFTRPGVRIFDEDAVGVGCTVFGFCDGATAAALNDDAVTRKRSDHKGESVKAVCSLNDLVQVQTFSAEEGAGADVVLTGWVSRRGVTPAPENPC